MSVRKFLNFVENSKNDNSASAYRYTGYSNEI